MPLIDLTYPAGTFSPPDRTALVDELTTVLLRAERAPDTEFFRSIAWVHVHELPDGTVYAAGRPVSEPTFRVQVTIPEGALSDRRKQELVGEATRVLSEAAGLAEADGLRVWVLIREVPDGNWGAGGQVVRFADLVRYASAEREQPGSATPVAS
ncbi:MAG TPA: tautomerase family protein [Solirubrobacteraceae bacterium]|nr:tautomerase family protein [Solirubrobacteraceae bacterium]